MRCSDGTNDTELINIELTNPVITINKDSKSKIRNNLYCTDFISVQSAIYQGTSATSHNLIEQLFSLLSEKKEKIYEILNSQDSQPVYAVGPDFQQGYSVPCIACWVTEPLNISIVEKLSALFDHKFEIVDHVLEIRDENMDSAIMQNEPLKDNQDNMSECGNENISATNGSFISVRSVAMAKREEFFQDFEIHIKLKAKINTNNILEFIIDLFHCGVGDMLNKNDWSLQGFVGFYLDSLIIEVSPLPDNKEGRLDLFTLTNGYNPLPPRQENSEVSKGYETNAGLQASFFPPGFSANCSVTNSHNRMATRDEWKMRMPSSAKTGVKWIYEFQGNDVNRGCPNRQLHSGRWYPNEAMTGFRIGIKQILRCRPKFRYIKLPEIFRKCPQITHTLEVSFNNITNFNEGFNELKVRYTEQQEIYVNFNGSDISKAAKSEIQTEDVPNQKEFISLNRIVSREPYTKQS
ncbi:31212_t:CDS:2 [Gigaspora margarita]|uniref:31212_t:CDS:1 n=1 Tax=Gigaspora margarita TaxID=4874 RepID=A0ABN7V635_GIGMA|nr:31212_t:CDS:2 [Gigaspora margarita]